MTGCSPSSALLTIYGEPVRVLNIFSKTQAVRVEDRLWQWRHKGSS